MFYSQYQEEIDCMAKGATEEARLSLTNDTVRLLHASVANEISQDLTQEEQRLLRDIIASIEQKAFDGLRAKLDALTKSMTSDEIRATEFHPNITELLSAIDNLLDYLATRNSHSIARIATNMVNSIDWALSGLPTDILAAPEMRAEYERQKRLLLGQQNQRSLTRRGGA